MYKYMVFNALDNFGIHIILDGIEDVSENTAPVMSDI